jgi:hypothetical protein
MGEMSIHIDI